MRVGDAVTFTEMTIDGVGPVKFTPTIVRAGEAIGVSLSKNADGEWEGELVRPTARRRHSPWRRIRRWLLRH